MSSDAEEIWDGKSKELEEITPRANSLYWSILLPYMISSPGIVDFNKIYNSIIGDKDRDEDFIDDMVWQANNNHEHKLSSYKTERSKPERLRFYDRIHSKINNITMLEHVEQLLSDFDFDCLMQIFKKRLDRITHMLKKKTHLYNDDLKLQAASNVLKCKIDLILYNNKNIIKSCTEIKPENEILRQITISRRKQRYQIVYLKNFFDNKRNLALKRILKLAGFHPDKISLVTEAVTSYDLLLNLLECSLSKIVLKIYESPYIVKTLENAGFNVNFRSLGNDGFSAFHKCIISDNSELLYMIHNKTVKEIYLKSDNTRELKNVFATLKELKKTIRSDHHKFKRIKKPDKGYDEIEERYLQIDYFNDYQYKLIKNVKLIKSNAAFTGNHMPNEILKLLLKLYVKYFYFADNKQSDLSTKMNDYIRYYDYYMQIDNNTLLCFFNYISAIKISPQSKKIINKVLVELLRYIISQTLFKKPIPDVKSPNNPAIFLTFCYRLNLKDLFVELYYALKEDSLQTETITNDFIKDCLENHPIILENYLILRLHSYLKVAKKISFSQNSTKAALVLQRTLQVLGEFLRRKDTNFVICPLLRYSLPDVLVELLVYIRSNALSKYTITTLQEKNFLEGEDLLEKVQKELNQIYDLFKAFYILQIICIREEFIENVQPTPDQFNYINKTSSAMKVNFFKYYEKYENLYILTACKTIDNLLIVTEKENDVKILKQKCKCLTVILNLIHTHSDHSIYAKYRFGLSDLESLLINAEISLENFKIKLTEVFLTIKANIEGFITNSHIIEFPRLNDLYLKIFSPTIFIPDEKNILIIRFYRLLKNWETVIDELKCCFVNNTKPPEDKMDKCKNILYTFGKTDKFINNAFFNSRKAIMILENIKNKIKNRREKVNTALKNDADFDKNMVNLIKNKEFENIIPQLTLSYDLHNKIRILKNQTLEFMKNRLHKLKEILIEEDETIKESTKFGIGTGKLIREHVKHLMVQRYKDETVTRCALETLLFDCLNVFKGQDESFHFKQLWLKTSDPLSGINIRNLLAHGSPIADIAINYLEEDNLPKQFINKVLDLLSDQESIEALVDLKQRLDYPNFEEVDSVIEKTSEDNYSDLREKILNCGRWKDYLSLLK